MAKQLYHYTKPFKNHSVAVFIGYLKSNENAYFFDITINLDGKILHKCEYVIFINDGTIYLNFSNKSEGTQYYNIVKKEVDPKKTIKENIDTHLHLQSLFSVHINDILNNSI